MHDIEERVRKIIAAQFCIEPAEVDLAANMFTQYGGDSLDQVEVVMLVEDEFGIAIPDDAMNMIATGQQLIECVAARM